MMYLMLIWNCLFNVCSEHFVVEAINNGTADIKIEESEFHLLAQGFYRVDLNKHNVGSKLSYYFVVEGKSEENEPYIFKSQRNYFEANNIPNPLCEIRIDTRDTLIATLKIQLGTTIIAEKETIWIRPKPMQITANVNTEIPVKTVRRSEIEIDGLIIDETKTKAGRDFYELFYNNWLAPQKAKDYTIYIAEEPARGRSTIIRVSINDQIVFRRFLQSRFDVIEELSRNALRAAARQLETNEDLKNEVEGGDQFGNGIF